MPDNLGRFNKGEHWRTPKPHWERAWLIEQYISMRRSTADIATDCGCTDANIIHWLRRHGISRRTISEARGIKHWGQAGSANPMHGKIGAANPRYVDGSSPERQRLYVRGDGRAFLRDVLKRDNYSCLRCGQKKSAPKSLHVHHIRPWAGNHSLRFDLENVVTLCRGCHHWVHSRENVGREFLA